MKFRDRKPLSHRADRAKEQLRKQGLEANPGGNPDQLFYLLFAEMRGLNTRLTYLLGALSIVIALSVADIFR